VAHEVYRYRTDVAFEKAWFYVGAGGQLSPNLSLPPAPQIFAYSSSAVVKPANSYTGGVIWRVGVVDLVVLACVLRPTTKKGRQLFVLPPNIFF